MIEQGFKYVASTINAMTDFFETKEERLEPKEEKKKSTAAAKKDNKKSLKKRNQEDSDSIYVE